MPGVNENTSSGLNWNVSYCLNGEKSTRVTYLCSFKIFIVPRECPLLFYTSNLFFFILSTKYKQWVFSGVPQTLKEDKPWVLNHISPRCAPVTRGGIWKLRGALNRHRRPTRRPLKDFFPRLQRGAGGAKGQMAEWREDTGRNERWEPRERSSEMDNDDEERGRGG